MNHSRDLLLVTSSLLALMISAPVRGQTVDEDRKLLADDGAGDDFFGVSVAASATTVIVGAVRDDDNGFDSGSAYLFDLATGQQLAKLVATDGAEDDSFGSSVAITGTIAMVGATVYGTEAGSAYVFDVTTGQQLAKLLPDDGAAYDRFGASIAIDGTVAIVGAFGDDEYGAYSGAAYLFDVVTRQQLAKLLPDDGAQYDNFGTSVAISGTTAIVGARGDDDNGSNSGAAYLFDVTTGQQLAKLLADDGAADDDFGCAVAIHGTTAIVGAPDHDANGADSGAAYLFDVTSGQQVAKLLSEDGSWGNAFAESVSLSEGIAAVGAPGFGGADGNATGAAYLFDVITGAQVAKLLSTDATDGDVFGFSISTVGPTVVVGAPGDDHHGLKSGAAYTFTVPGPDWILSPVNGHWYRITAPLTWADAEEQAHAWGGHLATVRGQAENDWLAASFIGDGSPLWIGYNDAAVEGVFAWSSGQAPGYENWRAGEPDDLNGADWAALVPVAGTWIDETFLPARRAVIELVSGDCDGNEVPDVFEAALQPYLDWNGDGVLDECVSANYCDAATNSTGAFSVIGASGSPLTVDNAFTLEAWDLPTNEFAYFIASESTAFVPGFGGGSGNLCLGAPVYRFNLAGGGGKILNSGPTGTVSFTLDLNLLPQGISFDPGETWYFQLWYRDVIASGPTSNASDGIEVLFR